MRDISSDSQAPRPLVAAKRRTGRLIELAVDCARALAQLLKPPFDQKPGDRIGNLRLCRLRPCHGTRIDLGRLKGTQTRRGSFPERAGWLVAEITFIGRNRIRGPGRVPGLPVSGTGRLALRTLQPLKPVPRLFGIKTIGKPRQIAPQTLCAVTLARLCPKGPVPRLGLGGEGGTAGRRQRPEGERPGSRSGTR